MRGWDADAATAWLARQLRAGEPQAEEAELSWWFGEVAEQLDDPALRAIVAAAQHREHEVAALWPDDLTDQTAALRQELTIENARDLWQRFAAALPDPRR